MQHVIHVTSEEILFGLIASPRVCPIGLALTKELPHWDWRVLPAYAVACSETGSGEKYTITLPVEAQAFIELLDTQGRNAVVPFEFIIEFPSPEKEKE